MGEKKKIYNFTDFIVWQKAIDIFDMVVKDTENFPRTRASFVIADQIIRSSGSISANIAEGFGRAGKNEFKYHLGVAKGSATESQDWYYKINKLKYLSEELITIRLNVLTEIIKMLNSLISKVVNQASFKRSD